MSNIFNFQSNTFVIFVNVFNFLLFLTFIGVGFINPTYLSIVHNFLKYYISLFLIVRFNPFANTNYTNLDKRVAFSSGMLLITTTAMYDFFMSPVKQAVIKIIDGISL